MGLDRVTLQGPELSFDPDLQAGEYVKLWVADTGHGIPEADLERIFDPYFTTKEVGKGSGLGLSVVLGIVKSLGGGVKVSSRAGQGASFEICLPAAEAQPSTPVVETPLDVPGGSERILFVDDEAMIVDMNEQRFKQLGYAVSGYTDPFQALERFREDPNAFDLVITDMTMPKLNGDDLGLEILKIRPRMPVILCTGHSEKINREKAEAIGLAGFLEKPLDIQTLALSVRQVLDGQEV